MYRTTKQNKKPPKRLPPNLLRELQEDIDKRLMRFAQRCIAEHYYDNYKKCLEKNSAVGMIPSSLYFPDAVKLLIHWRLYYLSHSEYKKFGVKSDSVMKRLVHWELELNKGFSDKYIGYPRFDIRKEYSLANNPEQYSGVTLHGTHCLIEYSPFEAEMLHPEEDLVKANYISHKLKLPALNTQVVLSSDGFVCAVSSSQPAGS